MSANTPNLAGNYVWFMFNIKSGLSKKCVFGLFYGYGRAGVVLVAKAWMLGTSPSMTGLLKSRPKHKNRHAREGGHLRFFAVIAAKAWMLGTSPSMTVVKGVFQQQGPSCPRRRASTFFAVIAAKAWMAGTSPAMTWLFYADGRFFNHKYV